MIKTFEVNGEIAIAFGDWTPADQVLAGVDTSDIEGPPSVRSWRCNYWTGDDFVRQLEVRADVRADGKGGLEIAYIGGTRFETTDGTRGFCEEVMAFSLPDAVNLIQGAIMNGLAAVRAASAARQAS